jgi:hypothetical protein
MRKATRRKLRPGLHPLDAITASLPFPDAELTRILVKVHDAFACLRNGSCDVDLFDRMAAVLNVGMVRCEAIGPEGVEVFKEAQAALMKADELFGANGRFGFTGPGLEAMKTAIELYEQILRASTPRQMADAQQECMRRVRAGQYQQAEAASNAANIFP